jgi:hypothetical protein
MYLHDLANAIDAGHRCYIAQKIEIEFLVKSSIDRVVSPDHEQRITVRRRTHHGVRRNIAASAWPVLDDELLPQTLGQPLADEAC